MKVGCHHTVHTLRVFWLPLMLLALLLGTANIAKKGKGMVSPAAPAALVTHQRSASADSLLTLQATAVRNGIAQSVHNRKNRADRFWLLGLRALEDIHYEAAYVFFDAFVVDSETTHDQSAGHYWMARAQEKMGQHSLARAHFEKSQVLSPWGYYGILARQRSDENQAATQLQCEEETNAFLEGSPNRGLAVTTHRKFHRLFPNQYTRLLSQIARQRSLDETWLIALARQESAFQPEAVSQSGAIGLMQILPETANRVLRRKSDRIVETSTDLFIPEFNATVGALYFRKLLRRFEGNQTLALAAYNAGPTAAARWQSRWGNLAPDLFVERIPFGETRKYVKRVTQWRAKYQGLLHSKQALARAPKDLPVLAKVSVP